MNGHPEFLELIAASIDFDLTDEEFGQLSTHLARCPECRRAADELRGDAAAIAAYPAPRLAPARGEQILRAALRTPPARPRWGLLAVAALLATLGGGVLFAGFQLVDDEDTAPSEPPPSLVAEASVPPSATPEDTAEPGAPDGGNPPPIDVPEPTPPPQDLGENDISFPLLFGEDLGGARVAPAPNDRLWLTIQRGRDTVVALLDEHGEGDPWIVPFATDCRPLAAHDGSVRLLCLYNEQPGACVDVCGETRIFAYSPQGDVLAGFPKSFARGSTNGIDHHHARMVADEVVFTEYARSDDGDTEERWLVHVRPDGTIVLGARVADPLLCCTIGPDGIAYGSTHLGSDGAEPRTEIIAFDQNGPRPGWPIVLDGTYSSPSFGPNGQLVFSSWIGEASRIARLNPDGSEAAGSVELPAMVAWSPEGGVPIPPLVDERGRAWVVTDDLILGSDASGSELRGFPYEPETGLLLREPGCGPGDVGCQSWVEPPRLAPRGLVYALEHAPSAKGDRITVIKPDGAVRSGWPKTLQRPGATWDSVTIGENRIAYAVAVEPEPNNEASISILAFTPDGSREWIRTIVEP